MAWPANVTFSGTSGQEISTLSSPHFWANNQGATTIQIGVQAQDYCIQSNSGVLNSYRWTDTPTNADYSARTTLRQRQSTKRGWAGPACRIVSGAATFYAAVQLQNSFTTGLPINEIRLWKYVSGTQNQLASVANTMTQSVSQELRLQVTGDGTAGNLVTLNVYLDGSLVIGPITDNSSPLTAAGFAGMVQQGTRESSVADHLETRAFETIDAAPPTPAYIDTNPIRNNTGTLLTGLSGLTVHVRNSTTLAHVVTLTNQTTNGSGVMHIESLSMLNGTTYIVDAMDSTGKMLHAQVYTAAL